MSSSYITPIEQFPRLPDCSEDFKIAFDLHQTHDNRKKQLRLASFSKGCNDSTPYWPIRRSIRMHPQNQDRPNSFPCLCDQLKELCGENCLNRQTRIECNPSNCSVGEQCLNRPISHNSAKNCYIKRVQGKGYGLFAKERIKENELIIEYIGEVIDSNESNMRLSTLYKDNYHYYILSINRNEQIDATSYGNLSRFINHSCSPNSQAQKWYFYFSLNLIQQGLSAKIFE